MMSEEEFTIESIGMEESYCDHSCILRGAEVISDGIPSADARSIVEILNGLYDENRYLKAKASSWKIIASQVMSEKEELAIKCYMLEKENRELNSIKKFAEKNGINIFLIDEAFRKCWKDNGKLFEENNKLRQKIKHCVYVDVDNANGCMNCKYDKGSICSILYCGTHDYLEGVSECGLKYWECKDE